MQRFSDWEALTPTIPEGSQGHNRTVKKEPRIPGARIAIMNTLTREIVHCQTFWEGSDIAADISRNAKFAVGVTTGLWYMLKEDRYMRPPPPHQIVTQKWVSRSTSEPERGAWEHVHYHWIYNDQTGEWEAFSKAGSSEIPLKDLDYYVNEATRLYERNKCLAQINY